MDTDLPPPTQPGCDSTELSWTSDLVRGKFGPGIVFAAPAFVVFRFIIYLRWQQQFVAVVQLFS